MESEFTIMTFNLRYAKAKDGNNSWQYRKNLIPKVINLYSPDLLGVQESVMEQSDYISEHCPQYYYYGVGRDENGTGEAQGIFYNKTLFSAIEHGAFWLSETPDIPGSKAKGAALTRNVNWAKLRHLSSGKFFYWFNTHLDRISEEARKFAATLLVNKINKMCNGLPVIITGDFNSIEKGIAWNILTESGFTDTRLTANEVDGPEKTFHGFMLEEFPENFRIDWVLIKNFKKVNYSHTLTFNENGKYPSDHYPVIVKLTL
jgi:endonuclease/exonuclease/phosphatase family metal-dependent hydrolase